MIFGGGDAFVMVALMNEARSFEKSLLARICVLGSYLFQSSKPFTARVVINRPDKIHGGSKAFLGSYECHTMSYDSHTSYDQHPKGRLLVIIVTIPVPGTWYHVW